MKDVTILFLQKPGQVLLALKKRGFGAGKWNGIGGKVGEGESIEQAVVRECQEEIGVTPSGIRKMAEIEFEIPSDEYFAQAHVYVCEVWDGQIVETEEMAPEWFPVAEIPYPDMWVDDIYWLPQVLSGKRIKARFLFGPDHQVVESSITPWN